MSALDAALVQADVAEADVAEAALVAGSHRREASHCGGGRGGRGMTIVVVWTAWAVVVLALYCASADARISQLEAQIDELQDPPEELIPK